MKTKIGDSKKTNTTFIVCVLVIFFLGIITMCTFSYLEQQDYLCRHANFANKTIGSQVPYEHRYVIGKGCQYRYEQTDSYWITVENAYKLQAYALIVSYKSYYEDVGHDVVLTNIYCGDYYELTYDSVGNPVIRLYYRIDPAEDNYITGFWDYTVVEVESCDDVYMTAVEGK